MFSLASAWFPRPYAPVVLEDPRVAALAPWFQRRRWPAWRPVVEPGDRSPTASKLGGAAWLAPGERWPSCPDCGHPLQLLLQLNTAELPAASEAAAGPPALLQAFYCLRPSNLSARGVDLLADHRRPSLGRPGDDLCPGEVGSGFQAFGGGKLVRSVAPPASADAAPGAAPPPALFPATSVVGWDRTEDFPHLEEQEEMGLRSEYRFGPGGTRYRLHLDAEGWSSGWIREEPESLLPHAGHGDKLGGWAAFAQGVEHPSCPDCGEPMAFLFQLESDDHLPVLFGDVGTAHLHRCARHPARVALSWAC